MTSALDQTCDIHRHPSAGAEQRLAVSVLMLRNGSNLWVCDECATRFRLPVRLVR